MTRNQYIFNIYPNTKQKAAGHRLGVVFSSFVTVVASLGIAFYCGWQLSLAILGAFPILILAGYIQVKVQRGGQKKDAALMEDAGQVNAKSQKLYSRNHLML